MWHYPRFNELLLSMTGTAVNATSKEMAQKLTPIAAAAARAVEASQPADEADDDACIICMDQPASVVFHPCNHCVTCPACAKLVEQRKQSCPLCRTPVLSTQ